MICRWHLLLVVFLLLPCVALARPKNPKALEVYFIDVEGGQATLFITPTGESLLIDAGWPEERDTQRILAVAKQAKLSRIDYVLITHYHHDHVGGVPALVEKIHVGTFLDHGALREPGSPMDDDYASYQKVLDTGKYRHIVAKPGDKLSIAGIDAEIVSSDGALIEHPLVGAGQPNSYCATTKPRPADETENARSVGTLLTFGKLRILDLGDLTWDKEMQLMCPANKLGKVDVYIVSHHGFEQSGSPALVDGVNMRVAIMDNAAKKGGSPSAWQIIHLAPGLPDLWQLHYSVEGGKEHNVPDDFIANLGTSDQGHYIRLTAYPNGTFKVFNSRTGTEKAY